MEKSKEEGKRMNKKRKFCHICVDITPAMKSCFEENPGRGGMYNWMFAHEGDIMRWRDMTKADVEKYDCVQINCSPIDLAIVPRVLDVINDTNTRLILNNDYVCECWESWNIPPDYYHDLLKRADMVFGTEPHQTSHLIDGAFCMPHPHRIESLKHHGRNLDMVKKSIGIQFKWWEGKTYSTYLLMNKLKKKYPEYMSRIYAYNQTQDRSKMYSKSFFDEYIPGLSYPDFIQSLLTNTMIYEGCSYHTYGRTSVDTAALKIPTLGTDRIWSMKFLWPNMVADPFDLQKQFEIICRVIEDPVWVKEQIDYAYEKCDYFNFKNSMKRFDAAYELCELGAKKKEGFWMWNDEKGEWE